MATPSQTLRNQLIYRWLPIGFALTVAIGFGYIMTQQALRLSADDPGVEYATDIALSMSTGQPSSSDPGSASVDMATSLTPFTVVYDAAGKGVAGTGKLNGQYTAPPVGVFDYVKTRGQRNFTWAPVSGVRVAAVLVPIGANASGGYVLGGRNLAEVERRMDEIGLIACLSWIVSLITSFGLVVVANQYATMGKAAS